LNRPNLKTARPRGALVAGRRDWYRIENFVDLPDTAAIYVYDEIGYWGVTAADFVRDLSSLQVGNIDLHINSPGGEVFEGIAIHSAIQAHPANVTVYVDGLAASAASFIAMAGDTIKIARNAQMMIHDASGLCIGNASDMREMADLLGKLSDNIADMYLQQAGGTVEAWRQAMLAETWFSADEALAAGLVDEIIGADQAEPAAPEGDQGEAAAEGETVDENPDATAPEADWDLSIFRYAGRDQAPNPAVATLTAVDPAIEEPAPAPDPEPDEWDRIAAPLLSSPTPDDVFATLTEALL
jgi:ATP-dependent Clp endopeptidase proteolytic subunit ClpP